MAQLLADAEALATTWAKADADIAAIVGTRVATTLPAGGPYPFLTVYRIGGRAERREYLEDRAYLQWDCYAGKSTNKPDIATASLLARTLVAKANTFQGLVTPPSGTAGVITGFEIITGPRRIPDPDGDLGRFLVETFLYSKPHQM